MEPEKQYPIPDLGVGLGLTALDLSNNLGAQERISYDSPKFKMVESDKKKP